MNFDMTPEPTVVRESCILTQLIDDPYEAVRVRVPRVPANVPLAPRHNPNTSYGRYYIRMRRWERAHPKTGFIRHLGWWWLHNIVVHPLIGYLPLGPLFALHDWTSKKLNQA